MDEAKKYELDKAWESMRYFLDYRLKVFNFFVAANGVLLTIILTNLKNENSRITLSFFALLISITMLLIDRRIIMLAHKYRAIVLKKAQELALNDIASVQIVDLSKLTLYNLFSVLYIITIIIWVILTIFIKLNIFIV